MTEQTHKRIPWIDVAKFFGIYSIYVYHFGENSQNAYAFVYVYCVPIFFLLSGFTLHLQKELGVVDFIKKKARELLLPFYAFSLLALILNSLIDNPELSEVDNIVWSIVHGAVRNHYFSPGLWFLTCLFVMEIVFYFIRKLKYPWLMTVVCFGLYLIAVYIITPCPADSPHWYYNVDSACYYIIYYAIGFAAFPYVKRFLELEGIVRKIIFYVVGFLTFCYSFLLYENVDFLKSLESISFISVLVPLFRTLIVICFVIFVSKITEHVYFFAKTGSDTLYLCGSEFLVKNLLPYLLGVFGISVYTYYPIQVFIYSFIVIVIGEKCLVPLERKMLRTHEGYVSSKERKMKESQE